MYNYVDQIMEQYELEVLETARSRGAYAYRTKDGLYLLKTVYGSEEKWDLLYEVQEFLHDAGFEVDRVVKNKEQQTSTKDVEGTRYLLLKTTEGREIDYHNRQELLKAAAHLAQVHSFLSDFPGEVPTVFVREEQDYCAIFEKHLRELKKVRNYMQQKRKKSDFERAFLEVYPKFFQQAKAATEGFRGDIQFEESVQSGESSGSGENREQLGKENRVHLGLLHGECTQHNLLLCGNKIGMVSWEGILSGIQIWDLCQFLRKIMEKNNWNISLGMEIIDSYGKQRPLTHAEKRRMYQFLAFPEKYWKIANHYYNSAKSWGAGRSVEKLERVIVQEDNRNLFLELLNLTIDK